MKTFLAAGVAAVVVHSLVMSLPPAPIEMDDHIIIDKMANEMFFYQEGEMIERFKVATGRDPLYTPEGSFPIVQKNVVGDASRQDLFGTRWMGLSVPGGKDGHKYGIHGTGDPESIGEHASAGCIRMLVPDAERLYEMTNTGTMVYIGRSRYHLLFGTLVSWIV